MSSSVSHSVASYHLFCVSSASRFVGLTSVGANSLRIPFSQLRTHRSSVGFIEFEFLRVVQAMAEWEEVLQASIIGLIFAFMVTKLVTLIVSFRGGNFRVARGDGSAVGFIAEPELAPEELNCSFVPLDDAADSDVSAEDSISGHDSDSGTDIPSVLVENVGESGLDLQKVDKEDDRIGISGDKHEGAEDRVAFYGEHSLKKMTDEAHMDAVAMKEVEEGEDTDEWEGVESSELEELFGAASSYVASMVALPDVKPSSDAMLQLYAFYKIATEGPCSTSQPSPFKPSARAKWNAWQKLGNLAPEEAMQDYIAVLTSINPTWHQGVQKTKKPPEEKMEQTGASSSQTSGQMGPVFSSLAMSEEGVEEEGCMEAIHACAREGDLVGLRQLLDKGTAVDLIDSDGRTPLIWAADRGQLSAVEFLLVKGAEINAKDIEGQTALHYATICEQEKVAMHLLEHGADMTIEDNENNTALSLCPAHWQWMRSTPT